MTYFHTTVGIKPSRAQTHTHMHLVLPDVYGEAAVAGHWVLVGALQGDGGFGSSTDFTAEDYSLPECTHHIRQRYKKLWSHCTQEACKLVSIQLELRFLILVIVFSYYSLNNTAVFGP